MCRTKARAPKSKTASLISAAASELQIAAAPLASSLPSLASFVSSRNPADASSSYEQVPSVDLDVTLHEERAEDRGDSMAPYEICQDDENGLEKTGRRASVLTISLSGMHAPATCIALYVLKEHFVTACCAVYNARRSRSFC